ncbi:MAG: Brp/Blh family beta-carotene 15,15'-dioxygenase [Flavobacteriaceae bacterium]|nr:Brp/Blh family beta-carotene 15,15'-dioxygenase [Flavobacteriaceae bacterium]
MHYIILKFIDYRFISTILCIILSRFFSETTVHFTAALGVLTVGILHGSNDLSLIKKLGFLQSKGHRFLFYIAFVLLCVIFLYRIPAFSLLIFILISAYHFGEQQWGKTLSLPRIHMYLFCFLYGLFLFTFLFYVHSKEVSVIINQISQIPIESIPDFKVFALSSFLALFVYTLLLAKHIKSSLIHIFIETSLLIFLFWSTDLLTGFAIYFVFWHSWPSMLDQIQTLYGSKSFVSKYLLDAWPYWLMSMFGLALVYFYIEDLSLDPLSLFFAFLASITFPHVLVIFALNRLFKPNTNA